MCKDDKNKNARKMIKEMKTGGANKNKGGAKSKKNKRN